MITIHKHDSSSRQPWEYLTAATGTYKAGQALIVTDGKLTAITDNYTTTPPYICMADATVEDGQSLPVIRVTDKAIYETTLSADATGAAAVGTKLQISAGGLEVNADAAGTFEVVDIEDTVVGSTVYGRFQ